MLAPKRSDLRLVNTDDRTAGFITAMVAVIVVVASLTNLFHGWIDSTAGIGGEVRIGFWFNLAIHLLLIFTIWKARHGLIEMMKGHHGDLSTREQAIAERWPFICIIVIAFMWLLVEFIVSNYRVIPPIRARRPQLDLFLILLTPAFDTMVRAFVYHGFPPPEVDDPLGLTKARDILGADLCALDG